MAVQNRSQQILVRDLGSRLVVSSLAVFPFDKEQVTYLFGSLTEHQDREEVLHFVDVGLAFTAHELQVDFLRGLETADSVRDLLVQHI